MSLWALRLGQEPSHGLDNLRPSDPESEKTLEGVNSLSSDGVCVATQSVVLGPSLTTGCHMVGAVLPVRLLPSG